MLSFPVLLEHELACGVDGHGASVRASVLDAATVVLVCRGADTLIVPAPDPETLAEVSAGIETMPAQRRSIVRIVDTNGSVLQQVRSFLDPLVAQAMKWPENAFVNFAEGFLYQVALAQSHRAGIVSSKINIMREFVPIISTASFRGEARYRLAELIGVIATYEPIEIPHALLATPVDRALASRIDEILEVAEFKHVVAASGWVGVARKPRLAVARLWRHCRALLSKPQVSTTLGFASAVGDIGGASVVGTAISKMNDLVSRGEKREFAPPFVPLGSAQLGIYRMALLSRHPDAVPPPGSIMLFEGTRGGRTGASWLSVGEESKLFDEEKTALATSLSVVQKVREVKHRFF